MWSASAPWVKVWAAVVCKRHRGSCGADVRESSGKREQGLDPVSGGCKTSTDPQESAGSDLWWIFCKHEGDTPDRVGRR
ncbi:hypothetical protein GCM10010495_23320 [Kitasatospora herbaricolor]|nr:hypothetical protein GCM10010495_23320 [Kitasatospora herbaricolor]